MAVLAKFPSVTAALAVLLLALGAAAVRPPAAQARQARAVLAFLPSGGEDNPKPVLDRLDARPQLALGLVSATQGRYSPEQAMLDVTAGSRTSAAVYDPPAAPPLELVPGGDGSGFIFGWSKALDRAATALAEIQPGLLAGQIPGGGAYAGVAHRDHLDAVAAADRAGDVARVSLGPAADLAVRVRRLLRRHRFVVAGLPTAAKGDAVLDALVRDRRPGDLLIVMQTPPPARAPQLLPAGVAGVPGGNGALTSPTTRLPGIVAGIDISVTILRQLGLPVPGEVKGQAMGAEDVRDAAELKTVEARLRVVSGRRTPMLGFLLFTWLSLTLALGFAADRRGIRAALRIGSLGIMWVLPMLLLTGWLAPSRLAEMLIVSAGAFGLGAITDRLVRWPRGPLVPAAVTIVAYATDLAFGSPLIIRSLLGVNPRSGSRFYGLGNELESTLTVLLMVGLGALLWQRRRSRGSAAIVAVAGLVLGIFTGAAELGADVGGVITVGAGIAAATLLMLPGRPSARRLVVAALVPLLAIVALAGLELATGANGHFTRTILHADSGGALWDVVVRRYTLAFNVLKLGAMPLVVVLALLAVAYAVRHRERIYAPLGDSPGWFAAFVGGLTSSIAGALFNDSGPLLFVFGVFVLACATAYVRGSPRLDAEGRIR
ncbi:MAG: hypothetical protein QOE11_39 [Solirubrobacteraceae bacterium]|jgi:hypothetical protein|nr:hypothetical protein [Solirubrobacteraceae bacterium]